MSEIRLPNITAANEKGQLLQIKSYLHQLVGELNFALSAVGEGERASGAVYPRATGTDSDGGGSDPLTTFASLKALIIKSADIVNAYYEEFNKRFTGIYVAQSDFGTFSEQTQNDIRANSKAIEQNLTSIQSILSDIESIEVKVNGHIHAGIIGEENGVPVIGVEIGQRTEVNGKEQFNKYARFTAEKLSFYNSAGVEVAYVSGRKLYITHIEVTGTFTEGGFVDTVQADGSIITRWVGRGGAY